MRIERDGNRITSVKEWREFAPPSKRDDHWQDGRSAKELARAWCGRGEVSMPQELRDYFDQHELTRGMSVAVAFPEKRIKFDDHGGNDRNADLAFVGEAAGRTVAVSVEAKAAEPFDKVLGKKLEEAGGSWRKLEEAGGSWRKLEEAGGSWRKLEEAGGSWRKLWKRRQRQLTAIFSIE